MVCTSKIRTMARRVHLIKTSFGDIHSPGQQEMEKRMRSISNGSTGKFSSLWKIKQRVVGYRADH